MIKWFVQSICSEHVRFRRRRTRVWRRLTQWDNVYFFARACDVIEETLTFFTIRRPNQNIVL